MFGRKAKKPIDNGPLVKSWAASNGSFTRTTAGARWVLELPMQHGGIVEVQRYPSCLAINISRYGIDEANKGLLDVFRRVIPLEDSMHGSPQISIDDERLELLFPVRCPEWHKKSPAPVEYKWLQARTEITDVM